MKLIDPAGLEINIDSDEMAVIQKALEIYKIANTSYTSAYGLDKKQTANLNVSERIISKLKDF